MKTLRSRFVSLTSSLRAPWRKTPGRQGRHPAQVLVLFALTAVPLMGFAGLAIDGGNIFVQRRVAQNGADAGALAAVRDIAKGGTIATNALTDAGTYATTNANYGAGAANSTVTVTKNYIDNSGTVVNTLSSAAGVRVTVQKQFNTFFIQIIGIPTYTVSAVAEGKVQAYAGGAAPFILCAGAIGTDGNPWGENILTWPNGVNSAPVINSDAIATGGPPTWTGPEFLIHDPHLGQDNGDCDWYGNQFKGDAADGYTCSAFSESTGCWLQGSNGTRTGPINNRVAGLTACAAGAYDGCEVVLPIAVDKNDPANTCDTATKPSESGNSKDFCIRAWVVVWLVQHDVNTHYGYVLGNEIVIGGTGVDCTPPCSGALVSKLSS